MSLTLQQMRDLVREGLGGLDEQDMSDPKVDRLLNLSFWELSSKFPFEEKNIRSTFATSAGTENYSLATEIEAAGGIEMEAFQGMSVVDDQGKAHVLQRATEAWLETQYSTATTFRGMPEYYVRRDDVIRFWPVPDDVYTIRVLLLRSLDTMQYLSVEQTGLPREWDELTVEGAITRGHYYNQDYNLAQQAENFRVMKIRTAQSTHAKEEEDSRYAGLIVQHEAPE
jgi:hypothetical protein